MVKIETTLGTIKVRLYDETPLHRDNFLKLVEESFYNDVLFHRVIKDFMIQAGDPESKSADSTARLGSGGLGYTIPAKLNSPNYITNVVRWQLLVWAIWPIQNGLRRRVNFIWYKVNVSPTKNWTKWNIG